MDGDDQGTGGPGTDDGQNQPNTDDGQGQPSTDDGQGQRGGQGAGGSGIESLPEEWQAEIARLRRQAGSARVEAKTKAAEEAQKNLMDKMAKAIGLKPDDEVTPDELQAQLAQATEDRRGAQIELAVHRSAAKAGGDPDALLDSRGFLSQMGKLDPGADDFDAQVRAAIVSAVKDNPKLSAGTPVTKSGGEISGGSGDQGAGEGWDDIEKDVRASFGRRR